MCHLQNSKSYTPCVCLPSLLELSLPQFSLSSVTDVRDLLTNMDPTLEAKLLGSEAEYNQLSKTNPFTIDKVRRWVLIYLISQTACVFTINHLCVPSSGGQQGYAWDVRGGRSSGKGPGSRHSSETLSQPSVLICCHGGTFQRHTNAGKDHQPYSLSLQHSSLCRSSLTKAFDIAYLSGTSDKFFMYFITYHLHLCR